jgi:uncharacterized membrane protein YqiK
VSTPEPYRPIVTRLPEAVQAEAEAIAEAERAAAEAERERALAETDAERLARESE